jgi:hypothetical protein
VTSSICTWAARQSLRLLDEKSGLCALYVEAADPSEHPVGASSSTPRGLKRPASSGAAVQDLATGTDEDDDTDRGTGDEVIDLAEYWGSTEIDETDRVIDRQLKHSTRRADELWTMSFLTKTLVGFAGTYRSLREEHPPSSRKPGSSSSATGLRHPRYGRPLHISAAAPTRPRRQRSERDSKTSCPRRRSPTSAGD